MTETSLIFIISQPRSGSTYLQRLLSNHPKVNTCSEPWILLNHAQFIKPKLVSATFNHNLAQWAFSEYTQLFPEEDFRKKQKEAILSLYEPLKKGFDFVIDKTPRYWELLHEIPLWFPKAKIIVLKRNPIAVAKSIMRTWNMNTLYEMVRFRRDLLYAPKVIHRFEQSFKDHENIRVVSFETITGKTEEVVASLCQWIGIPYHPDMLLTENNSKVKGAFGDPYQNTEVSYAETIQQKDAFKFTRAQTRWLQGYVHYLGTDFLKAYGAYHPEGITPKKTGAFTYFANLPDLENTSNEKQHSKSWKHAILGLFYQ